jgi:hypothetical protein
MKIQQKSNRVWTPCPEVDGQLAQIVDVSDTFILSSAEYEDKEVFRIILEINELNEDGYRFTVSTRPFTVSLHEKANLRKFVEKVLGRELTPAELEAGFEVESLIGKFCKITVEHAQVGDKTYANIALVSKAKEPIKDTWKTDFIRLKDRPSREEGAKAPATIKKQKTQTRTVEKFPVPEGVENPAKTAADQKEFDETFDKCLS